MNLANVIWDCCCEWLWEKMRQSRYYGQQVMALSHASTHSVLRLPKIITNKDILRFFAGWSIVIQSCTPAQNHLVVVKERSTSPYQKVQILNFWLFIFGTDPPPLPHPLDFFSHFLWYFSFEGPAKKPTMINQTLK